MPRHMRIADADVELVRDVLTAAAAQRQRAATAAAAELYADPGTRDKRPGALRIAGVLREAALLGALVPQLDQPIDADETRDGGAVKLGAEVFVTDEQVKRRRVERELDRYDRPFVVERHASPAERSDADPYDDPDLHLPEAVERIYREGITAEDERDADDPTLLAVTDG